GVAMGEFGNGALGNQRIELLFFELLNDVHFENPFYLFAGAPLELGLVWTAREISRQVERPYTRPDPGSLGLLPQPRPEVRPPLARQHLGLLAPPRLDASVIARGEDFGNVPPLEHLRPRIVRIFEQPVLKAL